MKPARGFVFWASFVRVMIVMGVIPSFLAVLVSQVLSRKLGLSSATGAVVYGLTFFFSFVAIFLILVALNRRALKKERKRRHET
jgi:hypothetical protein